MSNEQNELTDKFGVNFEFDNADDLVTFVENNDDFLEQCENCPDGLVYVRLKGNKELGIDFDRVFAYDYEGALVGMIRQNEVFYFDPSDFQSVWLEPTEQEFYKKTIETDLEKKGLHHYRDIRNLFYIEDYFVLCRDVSKLSRYKEHDWMLVADETQANNCMAGTFRDGNLVSWAANGCSFREYDQKWLEKHSYLDGFFHSSNIFFEDVLQNCNPNVSGNFFFKKEKLHVEFENGNISNISNEKGNCVVFPSDSKIKLLLKDKTQNVPKGLTSENVAYLSDYQNLLEEAEKSMETENSPTPQSFSNPYWTGEVKTTVNVWGRLESSNNQPALIEEDRAYWCEDGKAHNLNGPAKIFYDKTGKNPPREEYWLNGQLSTKEIVDKERAKLEKALELYVLPYIEGNQIPTDVTEVKSLNPREVTKPGWYRVHNQYYYLQDCGTYKKGVSGVVKFSMKDGYVTTYRSTDGRTATYRLEVFQIAEAKHHIPENATDEYKKLVNGSVYSFSVLEDENKKSKATGAFRRYDPRTKTFTFFWLKNGKLHRENGPAIVSPFASVNAIEGVVGETSSEVFQETLQKFFKRAIRGYTTQVSETKAVEKETKETKQMKDSINVRSEAEEMAYRTATNQFRGLIKNFLADRMGESTRGTKKQKEETRRAAVDFFNSEVGSLVITGAIGALVPMAEDYIPGKYAGYVERISKEMRVHAMAGMGNHMIDMVREHAGDIFSRSQSILDTLDAATVLEEAKKGTTETKEVVSVSNHSATSNKKGV